MEPSFFATPHELREWFAKNHNTANELLVGYYKKATGKPSITWTESVQEALCFGWIDGIRRRIDDESYSIRFTPRRARSVWSKINRQHVENLVKEGRMQPAGLAAVEEAKRNGQWDKAYDSPSTAEVPQDLLAALAKNKQALAFFKTLNKRNLYAIVYSIQSAKKPETRAKRIKKFVEMFASGKKLYD